MLLSGEIHSAMDRGDVVVTAHPRVYCPAFHYHPITYRDGMWGDDENFGTKHHMRAFATFVHRFHTFFGKFYSSDAMIEKTPMYCYEFDPEDLPNGNKTPRTVPFEPDCGLQPLQRIDLKMEDLEDLESFRLGDKNRLDWFSGARRLIMAAIACPCKLVWYVGPGVRCSPT